MLAASEPVRLTADMYRRRIAGNGGNAKWQRERARPVDKFVFRAFQRTGQFPAVTRERIAAPAFVSWTLKACGELRKAPLRSTQIGRTHGRQEMSVEFLGRKSDRHADDCAGSCMLAEDS